MRARRWIVVAVTATAFLLVLGRVLSGWYVDAEWYAALGAAELWRAKAANLVLIRGGLFLVGTLFVFGNLYAVRYSVQSLVLPRRVGNLEIGEEVPGRVLVAVVALAWSLKHNVGASEAAALSRVRTYVCAETGEPFAYELRAGDTSPVAQ